MNISGIVYLDAGNTPDLAGRQVAVAVGGTRVALTTSSTVDGTFSVSLYPVSPTPIAVYLQDPNALGVRVFLSNGQDVLNADIYENWFIMASGTSPVYTTTLTELKTLAGNTDSGIQNVFTAATSGAVQFQTKPGIGIFCPAGVEWPNDVDYVFCGASLQILRGAPVTASFTMQGQGNLICNPGNAEIANLTIQSGSYTLTQLLRFSGTLLINQGASLDVGPTNPPIYCYGSFINNGVFVARQGTLIMSPGRVYVLQTGSSSLYNLAKEGMGTVVLDSNLVVQNQLQQIGGLIDLNGFTETIG